MDTLFLQDVKEKLEQSEREVQLEWTVQLERTESQVFPALLASLEIEVYQAYRVRQDPQDL